MLRYGYPVMEWGRMENRSLSSLVHSAFGLSPLLSTMNPPERF
jgi:hypothetical protein